MTLKHIYPWFIGIILAVVVVFFSSSLRTNERLHRHDVLEVAAERIKQRITAQISALYAVRGLYVGSDRVTRSEFQEFIKSIGVFSRARGMQGLGFAVLSGPEDTTSITSVLQENYGIQRSIWPTTKGAVRFPIVVLEPQDKRNRNALGYDMYSEATRRTAMDGAWSTGTAVATRPVTLVQETGKNNQAGFLIYLPYYKKAQGTPTGTKNKAINGFVYAAFRAGDLMQTVLSEKPAVEVGIRAYSGVVKPQNLLYANVNLIADPSVHTIQVAGRKWIFELEDHSIQRWNFWNLWQIVLGLGLLLSLAFALFLRNQTEHAENAELISQAARARALEKDILLKEMTHRLKNAISRIVSIARMSSKGTSSKEEFVTSLTGRLQAMAAAQELLASSSAQKMNIRDLIHKEFDLIFGTATGRVRVHGSGITINELQSQALGLIVHELATNSTKYGAFKGDGKITVQLRKIKLETGKFDAHISWMETGIDGTAEFSREGFGSKLLKMMVEGQLNGRINRVPSPGQLLISIQFPMSD